MPLPEPVAAILRYRASAGITLAKTKSRRDDLDMAISEFD
jgi:hypothetical protein